MNPNGARVGLLQSDNEFSQDALARSAPPKARQAFAGLKRQNDPSGRAGQGHQGERFRSNGIHLADELLQFPRGLQGCARNASQNRRRSPNHSKKVTNQFLAIAGRLAGTLDIPPIPIAFQGPNDNLQILRNLAWRRLNVTCNSYKGPQLIATGGPWYEPLSWQLGCDSRRPDWLRSRVPGATARCEMRMLALRV